MTMAKSASLPPVMKVFSPLRIQSSPSRRARNRMLAASEPAPGSVMAKQEFRSPSMVGSRNSCRCSAVAWNRMLSASPPKRNGTKVRPISVQISDWTTAGRSMPPYSAGVANPQKPNLRALSCNSLSSERSRPGWWARSRRSSSCSSGMTSRVMKSRAVSRIARSSSDSPKSMCSRFLSRIQKALTPVSARPMSNCWIWLVPS